MSMDTIQPLVFSMHHFALDDGPGIRTTVFFKGCPLSCAWCHNPESISPEPEIAFYREACIDCGDCLSVCPEGAVDLDSDSRISRDRCSLCGTCAETCPAKALRMIGQYYPADELTSSLMKDRVFYETSGGGVTFSGGEPALHADYLHGVMKELKSNGIHIAIQTSGMFDLEEFTAKLLPCIDIIYYDIKLFDPGIHRQYTRAGNERILNNFAELAKMTSGKLIPRIPLVPGITDTPDNLIQTAKFLRSAGCLTCELLPYNSGGAGKRQALGKHVPDLLNHIRPDMKRDRECSGIFYKYLRGDDHNNSTVSVKGPGLFNSRQD